MPAYIPGVHEQTVKRTHIITKKEKPCTTRMSTAGGIPPYRQQCKTVLTMTMRARFTQMARFVSASMLDETSSINMMALITPWSDSPAQQTEIMVALANKASRYMRPLIVW